MSPEPLPKILVVDDEPSILTLMCTLLEDEFEPLVEVRSEHVQATAAREQPHLILLDVVMPYPDGFEVCRRLKADPATRDIPVIFLTGRAKEEDMTRGFELGAVDYVSKPFQTAILLSRVRTHVQLRERDLELKMLVASERMMRTKLEEALAQVKQLSGLLPICAKCKKIRDEQGAWTQLEDYLRQHSTADFSHGICQECATELYPELGEE